MSDNNNKSKIIYVLFGIIQTAAFGWCWKISSSVEVNSIAIATLNANKESDKQIIKEIKEELREINRKLDRMRGR